MDTTSIVVIALLIGVIIGLAMALWLVTNILHAFGGGGRHDHY